MPSHRLVLPAKVIDQLMRDLAGHDRSPAAFLVWLWLWRGSLAEGRQGVSVSLQSIASGTGLSKSAVQIAVRHLVHRGLLRTRTEGRTLPTTYSPIQP